MKKLILSLSLTSLTVLCCTLTASAYETKGQEIKKIDKTSLEAEKECEASKDKTRNFVESVEQKAHEVAQKSQEIMQNVKEGFKQKKYESHMMSVHRAKARAEKKAHALQTRSIKMAQKAHEASQRAEQIAKHIETEQKVHELQ